MRAFDIVYTVDELANGKRTRRAIVMAQDATAAKLLLVAWNAPANLLLDIIDCEEAPEGHVIHVQY